MNHPFLNRLFHSILFLLSALFVIGIMTVISAAIIFPNSPESGLPIEWRFILYFNKILVNTGTSTDGLVRNSSVTQQIGMVNANTLAKWDNSSKKLLDTSWWLVMNGNTLTTNQFQLVWWTNNQVLISDSSGVVKWETVDNIISTTVTQCP